MKSGLQADEVLATCEASQRLPRLNEPSSDWGGADCSGNNAVLLQDGEVRSQPSQPRTHCTAEGHHGTWVRGLCQRRCYPSQQLCALDVEAATKITLRRCPSPAGSGPPDPTCVSFISISHSGMKLDVALPHPVSPATSANAKGSRPCLALAGTSKGTFYAEESQRQ